MKILKMYLILGAEIFTPLVNQMISNLASEAKINLRSKYDVKFEYCY